MTRYNPQYGANMVDRYIGSAFDIVYAVYKQLGNMPVFLEFVNETSPRMEDQYADIIGRFDHIVQMEASALNSKEVAEQAAEDAMEYRDTTQALIDEAEEFKQFVTNVVENTIQDIEDRFAEFIVASGYEFIGNYGIGIEVTEYNQLLRDVNGEFWRLSGHRSIPYITTGAGLPEDDAFIPVGDASLRQDLDDPVHGSKIIKYDEDNTVYDAINRNREDFWANKETMGGIYTHYVREDDGTPVAGAECAVYVGKSGVLATGLKDKFGEPLANPFVSAADGLVQFVADPGMYTLQVSFDLVTHTYSVYFADDGLRNGLGDPTEGANLVAYGDSTVQQTLQELEQFNSDLGDPDKGAELVAYKDSTVGESLETLEQFNADLANPDKGGELVQVTTSTGEQTLVEALDRRVIYVDTIADLQAMDTSGLVDGQAARISTTGRAGDFVWSSSDQSGLVAADPKRGALIPPDYDQSGASGAWLRTGGHEFTLASHFGYIEDEDPTDAINAALLAGQHIFVPSFLKVLQGGIELGYGKKLSGRSVRTQAFYQSEGSTEPFIELGDGSEIVSINAAKENAVRNSTGIAGGIPDGSVKWAKIDNVFVTGFDKGIHLTNYYHTLLAVKAHNNNIGIQIGVGESGYSGATSIMSSHIRNNRVAGIVCDGANQVWIKDCTFEFNRAHIHNINSSISVKDAYLADTPVEGLIADGGVTTIDLSGHGEMVSGGSFQYLEEGEDPYSNYPVFCIKSSNNAYVKIKDSIIGVMLQVRPGSNLVGSCISYGGNYEFENSYMYIGPGAANGSIYPAELASEGYIVNKHPIKNYIPNGTFTETSTLSNTYLGSGYRGIVPGIKNPWGGSVLDVGDYGISFKYKVPERLVGKRMLLMAMLGERSDSPTTMSLYYPDSDVNVLASDGPLNKANLQSDRAIFFSEHQDTSGRKFAGFGRVVVTPNSEEGTIRLFFNGGGQEVAGVVLTEITPYMDSRTVYPFGYFESQDDPIPL